MTENHPRRILFITLEYGDLQGGAGVYAYELTRALAQKGCEIHVIVPAEALVPHKLPALIKMHKVNFTSRRFVNIFSWSWNLRKIVKKLSIDLEPLAVHVNTIQAANINIGNANFIATIHHPFKSETPVLSLSGRVVGRIYQYMEKQTLKRANTVFVDSKLTNELLAKQYPWAQEKMVTVGVLMNLDLFRMPYRNKTVRLKSSSLIIFAPGVGRERRKGAECLLSALEIFSKTYPDFQCIITGGSRERGWQEMFDNLIKTSRVSDRLLSLGEVSRATILELYQRSDLVVFPSLFEGFGIPILEAMAAGKPIVASRTGEAPLTIKHNFNGYLFEVGDSKRLASLLLRLVQDKKLRDRVGKNAKQHSKAFSWDSKTEAIVKFYDKVSKYQ